MDKAVSRHFEIYIFSIILRLGVECFFAYEMITLFGFEVPGMWECTGFPCPNTVPCFISRPYEKTIFLLLMHVFTLVSIILNISEIIFLMSLGCKKVREAKAHMLAHLTGRHCIRTKKGRQQLKAKEFAALSNNRRISRKRSRENSSQIEAGQSVFV